MCTIAALCLVALMQQAGPAPSFGTIVQQIDNVRNDIYEKLEDKRSHCFLIRDVRLLVCGEENGVLKIHLGGRLEVGREMVSCTANMELKSRVPPAIATSCATTLNNDYDKAVEILHLGEFILKSMTVSHPVQWQGDPEGHISANNR